MIPLDPALLHAHEGRDLDRKFLRLVSGRNADWSELAKDCVAFANAVGGRLLLGVEDDADCPDPAQRVDPGLVDLVEAIHGSVTIDWTQKEAVRADMRRKIKRLLKKLGYPQDKQAAAVVTVIRQAERVCRDWARVA